MTPEISIAFQTDKSATEYIALAQNVNQYDFDAVSVYCDAPFQPSYSALLLMAPHLTKARLGPSAIPLARMHPIDIAANAALLETLAPNRTYIGIARGAWLKDHSLHEPTPSLTAIREAIHIIQQLLRGEHVQHQGKVYQIAEYVRATYPLPQNLPPILIGTWGRKLCELAGEMAHEVKVGGSTNPSMVSFIQADIAQGEMRQNRERHSVGVVMGAVTVVDEDREKARAVARQQVAMYLPVVAPLDRSLHIDTELTQRIQALVEQHDFQNAGKLISDDLLNKFAFSGAPKDLIEQASQLFAAGAARVEFGTPHGLPSAEGIRLIGEQVIPALQSTFR